MNPRRSSLTGRPRVRLSRTPLTIVSTSGGGASFSLPQARGTGSPRAPSISSVAGNTRSSLRAMRSPASLRSLRRAADATTGSSMLPGM